MTAQKKNKSPKAKPAVEAPVEEVVVEEVKVEAKAEPEIVSAPVKVDEPERVKLESYERPETNQHEGESKWVEAEHGITQHLYGMGRLKHRMRTRKSRYEQ